MLMKAIKKCLICVSKIYSLWRNSAGCRMQRKCVVQVRSVFVKKGAHSGVLCKPSSALCETIPHGNQYVLRRCSELRSWGLAFQQCVLFTTRLIRNYTHKSLSCFPGWAQGWKSSSGSDSCSLWAAGSQHTVVFSRHGFTTSILAWHTFLSCCQLAWSWEHL